MLLFDGVQKAYTAIQNPQQVVLKQPEVLIDTSRWPRCSHSEGSSVPTTPQARLVASKAGIMCRLASKYHALSASRQRNLDVQGHDENGKYH
ncbi:hypothetical protein [Phyllobacterium bourgognense]|uniref:hypothetical protein n=1 Tax=Phyllobacterium bourgognense TaxID=314236 RepID=UPI0011C05CD6|nr:hypothetical protein [Phyllobacterium bourgognense]